MRTVYTTGQVAKICHVAPRTVAKWFDAGILKGFRVPMSEDRRIPRLELLRFLKQHGMDSSAVEADRIFRAVFGFIGEHIADVLTSGLRHNEMELVVERPQTWYELGIAVVQNPLSAVVLDTGHGLADACRFAEVTRKLPGREGLFMGAVVGDDYTSTAPPEWYNAHGSLGEIQPIIDAFNFAYDVQCEAEGVKRKTPFAEGLITAQRD